MNEVILRSNTIVLRPFSIEDVDSYYAISHDDTVKQYIPGSYVETNTDALSLLSEYEECDFETTFHFAICDSKTGQLLGALLASRLLSPFHIEVGYFIGTKYRGNGYSLQALQLFIDHLVKHTTYSVLFFEVRPDNASSRKIIQKLGIQIQSETQEYFRYNLH